MSINTLNAHQYLHSKSWGNIPLDAFAYLSVHFLKERKMESKQWIVLPKEDELLALRDQLRFWGYPPEDILIYPANDIDSLQGLSPTRSIPQQRILALNQWNQKAKGIMISSVFGLMHKSISKQDLESVSVLLQKEEEYEIKSLLSQLQNMGYLYESDVSEPGTFHHHGDAIRVWGIGEKYPVRLSFFDTELEEIHRFIGKKRDSLKEILILPAREIVLNSQTLQKLSRHLIQMIKETGKGRELRRRIMHDFNHGLWFPGAEEYLPALFNLQDIQENPILLKPDACQVSLEYWSNKLNNRWELYKEEQRPLVSSTARFSSKTHCFELFRNAWKIDSSFASGFNAETIFEIERVEAYRSTQQNIDQLLKWIRRWQLQDYQLIFVAQTNNRLQRLGLIFKYHDLCFQNISNSADAKPGEISLIQGYLEEGFIDHEAKLGFFGIEYILKMPKTRRNSVPQSLRDAVITNIAEIGEGEFIVHREHGIGKFLGIVQRKIRGIIYDCIQLEYANQTYYYLPISKIEQLYRYRTTGNKDPKLDKIGSKSWNKRVSKAKEKAFALADQLIAQFAIRASQKGYQYQGYPKLLNDFSFAFPYQETPDQQSAIDDVLKDLTSERPMNRLIIGDVGFGKTEVALRAAIRVVAEGHQVALLCPTTILAMQHHRNFIERCFPFGIKVGILTRMQTGNQKKKLLRLLEKGELDILIGTRAIFNKQVRFNRLGLVIADEEHRFGVKQKEQLKNLSQLNLEFPTEYMAMSATPIPRTLHLALSGLREVSVIATPPPHRKAIQTHFMRFNLPEIAKQIRYELKRGGQVFFVHNRIENLQAHADLIQSVVPEAIIAVASGRSTKKHMEQAMLDLLEHRCHVLVCTTIIENGIDLPNVNTIIINNAQNLGLAQLYQLRGRVGRGKEQGHCTLLIPAEGLENDALSRISALRQYTALGSGFAIANADLEIRGSGDLLGKEQSGHIEAIGLDTYIDILNEAILELKPDSMGHFLPEISLPLSAFIPASYISEVDQRLTAYRRMATARSFEDMQSILDDWEEQYGPVPELALQTLRIAEIRMWARNLGIERIDWLKSNLRLISHPSSPLSSESISKYCERNKKWRFTPFKKDIWQLQIPFSYEESKEPLIFINNLYPKLESLLPPK